MVRLAAAGKLAAASSPSIATGYHAAAGWLGRVDGRGGRARGSTAKMAHPLSASGAFARRKGKGSASLCIAAGGDATEHSCGALLTYHAAIPDRPIYAPFTGHLPPGDADAAGRRASAIAVFFG